MAAFSLIFAVLSSVKSYTARKGHWMSRWIPSGVAFAIGFLNPPAFSMARLIGGVIEYIFHTKFAKDRSDIRLIVIASGFVLGEGVVGIATLVLKLLGIGAITCFGCGHGFCVGCPPPKLGE
jgi:uncharacterized oligopeptide transporter (OPT) family protein